MRSRQRLSNTALDTIGKRCFIIVLMPPDCKIEKLPQVISIGFPPHASKKKSIGFDTVIFPE